jgi:perosamine synthetase
MKLPIPWTQPDYWGAEREYVLEALESTWISGGPFVDRFEARFAAVTGARHALTASNGTSALHMAFLALGIGPGDEVIVPGFAFQAAANVALHVGARPVFVEIDRETWCLTAEAVARSLTPRTKAIVPVHTYGNVCDMDAILALAGQAGIAVVEDAAEAFCSRFKGKHAGTMGTVGTFSFHPTKTMTTGEGGMVTTADEALRDRMALYRSHGMPRTRYRHVVVGHNFRLTNLQAALGCAQLENIDVILRERKRVHARYDAGLADIAGVRPQRFPGDVEPVLWAIALMLDARAFPQGRDAVMGQLQEAQIETRPGFYAASVQPLYSCPRLPICEEVGAQVISLPTFASMTDDQIDFVCQTLRALQQ